MSPDPQADMTPRLRAALRDLTNMRHAERLMSWDETINMPPDGSGSRGRAIGAMAALVRDRWADAELGTVIPAAPHWWSARREHEVARRVPSSLIEEIAEATSAALAAWQRAREADDFAVFAPFLRRNIELQRRWSDCFPDADHPYDPLLRRFEPEASTEWFRSLIETLREGIAPLQRACSDTDPTRLASPTSFPPAEQRRLGWELARWVGVDADAARFDDAPHPFTYRIGRGDVRFTSRWDPSEPRSGLMCVLHEAGHALYEQQIAAELDGTMLDDVASFGLHEAQARLWENLVGRSRAFWEVWLPRLTERFPELAGYGVGDWLAELNALRPTTIRVEADELGYHDHILLRFELEVDLVTGVLEVDDVTERWDARTMELTGVPVSGPRQGALQDIHWCFGELGYFPTYTIGSMGASQLWRAAGDAIGDLAAMVRSGDVTPLREWLGEQVHRHGLLLTSSELFTRATGHQLSAQPLVDHLWARYGALVTPASRS
jgi:carboxypeptidase Taq